MDIDAARELLRKHDLRVTSARLDLLVALSEQTRPLSHGEILELMPSDAGDPATIYRNLVRFAAVGLLRVLEHSGGMDRYELREGEEGQLAAHPHFVCRGCGDVSCLPQGLVGPIEARGPWRRSLRDAEIELQGLCPKCLEAGK